MRRAHRGVGRQEVLNKVLQLKPDMWRGVLNNDDVEKMERFNYTFDKRDVWFRKCNQFSIRSRTSVGQKFLVSYDGLAWATLMKVRAGNKTRATQIYASRSATAAPAHGQTARATGDVDVAELSAGQQQDEVFSELGNMDKTPIQHEKPVETTLENTGAKDARTPTAGEADKFLWHYLERIQLRNSLRFLVHVGNNGNRLV